MKRTVRCIVFVMLLCFFGGGCSSFRQLAEYIPWGRQQEMSSEEALTPELPELDMPDDGAILEESQAYNIKRIAAGEFRAVWVATVLNLDFPSRQNLSAAAMRREIDAIAAYTADLGLNAVIFQVRPAGDAFYRSDIFPWSQWLSGTQGQGVAGFDPLEYWTLACRENGLELYAWLNPYRIIHTDMNSSDPETLAPDNPVRLHPELAVGWSEPGGNAGLFLDPGLPEARALIVDGVAEIITKYDVDGIQIDDYFYPGTDFDDAASYARYGNGMALDDWRRENVNQLIRDIQAVIRELNEELGKNVRWGVSPTAIWQNVSNDPHGVATNGGRESYRETYSDTRRWVMEEWVDYICPQIYWYIGYDIADFKSIFDWWGGLCKDYNVDLYIGHAAYRETGDDQSPRWRGEMVRQLEMATGSETVKGSVFYRFESLRGVTGNSIRDFYAEKDGAPARPPVMIIDRLVVGTPLQDTTITASRNASAGFNITGASDPDKPLYLNEAEITNRTIEGFFSVFAPLEAGENVFTFSQEGQSDVTRIITRITPALSTASPAAPTTVTPVTAQIYATVIDDAAWVFSKNSQTGGSDWIMSRGQTDRVVAESSNGFVKLSCGVWTRRDSVALADEPDLPENTLQNGEYRTGKDRDMVVWQSIFSAAAHAGFDGQVLKVSFGMHTEAPPLNFADDLSETIFESVRSGKDGDTPFIAFTIREDARFEGCYIDYYSGELRLHLKKRKTLAEGDRPLAGIRIVLDPGHGGNEYGATGPLGRLLPEKNLNLINARNLAEGLKALGANVYMTRETDMDMTLQERVDFNLRFKPDLFISLHVNNVEETTNASNIRGFTVWYRNPASAEFSQTLLDIMYYINPATNRYRNINQANFFVCRPGWAPAVILEAGFIINIDDFVWLIDPAAQNKMAEAAIEAILEYFTP